MSTEETYEAVARAHAIHKMHLQAIGTLVVRQLVKDNAINIEKLEDACMDLRLVEVDENGKFTALPITIK
jgi:stage V sporulation protein SpoVS